MPTHEERATQHTALLATLGQLEALQPDQLRRLDLPPALNFDGGTPYFEETWRLFRDLAQTPLDRATFSLLSRLNTVAQQNLAVLQQIKAFNPESQGANARPQRDVLLQQVRDIYDTAFDAVMMARAYLGHPETDVARVGEDARRILSRTEALFEQQQAALAERAVVADRVLDALRQSAASVGIAQFAGRFEAEANAYKAGARYWLIATIAVGVVTIGFGARSFAYTIGHVGTWTPLLAIQLTVSKVIIFSVL